MQVNQDGRISINAHKIRGCKGIHPAETGWHFYRPCPNDLILLNLKKYACEAKITKHPEQQYTSKTGQFSDAQQTSRLCPYVFPTVTSDLHLFYLMV